MIDMIVVWDILKIVGPVGIGWLGKMAIDRYRLIESRVNTADAERKEIKENYLDRFEAVNKHISEVKEEIVSKITELRVDLARFGPQQLKEGRKR